MKEVQWNQAYLLGYYGPDGTPYLTTWAGDMPLRQFFIVGINAVVGKIPLWSDPNIAGVRVYLIEDGYDLEGCSLQGIKAIGWFYEDGTVVRK